MKPPSSKTLGRLLQEQAEERGDADAIVFATGGRGESPTGKGGRAESPTRNRHVGYRELLGEVRRLALGFLALGLRPGDRIVAWLPNSVEWIVADLAAVSIGCVFVGGNTWYRARELHYVLRQSGARLLLVTDRFLSHDYEAEFAALASVEDPSGERGGAVVPSLPRPGVRRVADPRLRGRDPHAAGPGRGGQEGR